MVRMSDFFLNQQPDGIEQSEIEKSKLLYKEAINLIKDILGSSESHRPTELKNIFELTSRIVDQIILYDTELLNLVNNPNVEENYLCVHAVNVSILSIEVGLGLGYNKSKLNELSVAALLHEARESLEDRQINEYSTLISLVDAYEGLTHPASSSKKYAPHEAIKEILSRSSKSYDSKMIKSLINRIGIYPVGSWVKLNTGEIGKVLEIDRDSPLRPKVYILFDSHKKKLEKPKIINLTEKYNIYIKRPVTDEEL